MSEHYEKVDKSGTFTDKAIEIKNRTHGPIRHHEKTKKMCLIVDNEERAEIQA